MRVINTIFLYGSNRPLPFVNYNYKNKKYCIWHNITISNYKIKIITYIRYLIT